MKHLLVLTLSLLLVVLAACGGGATTSQPTEAPAASSATEESNADAATDESDAESGTEGESDAATDESGTEGDTDAAADESDTATDADAADESDAEDSGDGTEAADTEDAAAEASEDVKVYTIVPEESEVSYSVDEVFLREGTQYATAVGITQEINGEVYYDPQNPQNSDVGEITIDISAFTSDSDRRDQAIRDDWLESATYPIATFQPTSIEGLPEEYTEGEEMTLQITGDLTVREVTTPVTFETTGMIEGDEMQGTATTTVLMTDFGFDPPDIANILKAENEVRITFNFSARANG